MTGGKWVRRSVRNLAADARDGHAPDDPQMELVDAWESQILTYLDYLENGELPPAVSASGDSVHEYSASDKAREEAAS